jgi:hypothetical protein
MSTSSAESLYIHRKTRMREYAVKHKIRIPRGFREHEEAFGKPAQQLLKRIQQRNHLPRTGHWNGQVQQLLFPVTVARTPAEWALWYLAYQERTHAMNYKEQRPMIFVEPPKVYTGVRGETGMDCSWFVRQCYKNDNWPDPMGEGYANHFGNTTSLREHGEVIPIQFATANDLGFYANPEHVVMCIGYNRVVSMGHEGDPSLEYLVGNYRPVQEVRRYPRK